MYGGKLWIKGDEAQIKMRLRPGKWLAVGPEIPTGITCVLAT